MKILLIIGFLSSVLGFFGALLFSSIFFGLFTVGLFLIIYSIIIKSEIHPTTQKMPILSNSIKRFCPQCGAELDENEEFCPLCKEKVKK